MFTLINKPIVVQKNLTNLLKVMTSTKRVSVVTGIPVTLEFVIDKAKPSFIARCIANKNRVVGGFKVLKYPMVLFSLLFLCPLTACGNDPSPSNPEALPFGVFPLNDVKWIYVDKCSIGYMSEPHIDTITYSVHQIDEKSAELFYHRKRVKVKSKDGKWIKEPTSNADTNRLGWIHLESKKVYFVLDQIGYDDRKSLLYDFSLKVDDSYTSGYFSNFKHTVGSISEVLVGNEYRKKYHFSESAPYSSLYAIESIGFGSDLLFPLFGSYNGMEDNHRSEIIEVYYKDKVIWKNLDRNPDWKSLWENE